MFIKSLNRIFLLAGLSIGGTALAVPGSIPQSMMPVYHPATQERHFATFQPHYRYRPMVENRYQPARYRSYPVTHQAPPPYIHPGIPVYSGAQLPPQPQYRQGVYAHRNPLTRATTGNRGRYAYPVSGYRWRPVSRPAPAPEPMMAYMPRPFFPANPYQYAGTQPSSMGYPYTPMPRYRPGAGYPLPSTYYGHDSRLAYRILPNTPAYYPNYVPYAYPYHPIGNRQFHPAYAQAFPGYPAIGRPFLPPYQYHPGDRLLSSTQMMPAARSRPARPVGRYLPRYGAPARNLAGTGRTYRFRPDSRFAQQPAIPVRPAPHHGSYGLARTNGWGSGYAERPAEQELVWRPLERIADNQMN